MCTCADEGLGLGSGRQRGSADGPGGQVGPVHSVLLAVEGDAHHDGALETPPQYDVLVLVVARGGHRGCRIKVM